MSLPAKFVERILRDLGEREGRALCAALDTEPPVSVRLNPAKMAGPAAGSGLASEVCPDLSAEHAGMCMPSLEACTEASDACAGPRTDGELPPEMCSGAAAGNGSASEVCPVPSTEHAGMCMPSLEACTGAADADMCAGPRADGELPSGVCSGSAAGNGLASEVCSDPSAEHAGMCMPSLEACTGAAAGNGLASEVCSDPSAEHAGMCMSSLEACTGASDADACAGPRAEGASFPAACSALSAEGPAGTGSGRAIPWSRWGRYLPKRPQFTLDPAFHAGAYYVQEASSQFVGHLLAGVRTAGSRILDLCAAPGGKTTLYASLAGADGLVVANEIDRRRAQVLADNVRKWGTGNVAVTTAEPRAVCDFERWFDVVAVDAPCSGEGMFRKDLQARGEWSEGNVKLCAARQDAILCEAWRALKPGGLLLYSTCTFNRDEDEGALERMLAWAGDEVVPAGEVPVDPAWGIVCGRVGAFRTYRFYPHRTCGEGFFAAVAHKSFDAGGRSRTPRARRTVFAQPDRRAAEELARWVLEPERMCFRTVADTCYAYRAAQFDAVKALSEALPVIYAGVALGQLFKGVLRPDPALAFFAGLDRRALPRTELGREEALRYLRKQELAAASFAEGVSLVCADGRALGFAKRIGGRVNNMYPNSLRIIKQ